MIVYEDECVGCPMGCIQCGRKHVPHCYCDVCGGEIPCDSPRCDIDDSYHVCEDCEPDEEDEE